VFVLEIKWNTSVVVINIKTAVLVSLEIRACFINKLSKKKKNLLLWFYFVYKITNLIFMSSSTIITKHSTKITADKNFSNYDVQQ